MPDDKIADILARFPGAKIREPAPPLVVSVAEVKDSHAQALRTQAWEEVEAVVDPREMVAHLGVLVGLLLEKAPLTAEEGAAIGPALQALGAIQARMESWHVVEEAIDAATTFEEVQAVKLPASPPIPAARAADVAKRLKERG